MPNSLMIRKGRDNTQDEELKSWFHWKDMVYKRSRLPVRALLQWLPIGNVCVGDK